MIIQSNRPLSFLLYYSGIFDSPVFRVEGLYPIQCTYLWFIFKIWISGV